MNLCLLSYNNYYNRTIKKFDTIEEYEPYIVAIVENYNFVPGDGVNTTLKAINYDGETQPDYVIVVDNGIIQSRWFIIDSDFIRKGQFRIALHRDLVADSYNQVINAPCFIEKATLKNNDPGIYNKENITVNQIKTSETKLKDETGTPWIVGYVPKDSFIEDTTIVSDFIAASNADITVDDITKWPYYKYSNLSENARSYMSNVDFTYVPEMAFAMSTNYPTSTKYTKAIMPFGMDGDYRNVHNDFYGKPLGGNTGYTSEHGIWKIYTKGDYSLTTWEQYTHPLSKVWLGHEPDYSERKTWFANLGFKVLEQLKPHSAEVNEATKAYFSANTTIDVGEDISNLNSKTIYDSATKRTFKISVSKEKKTDVLKGEGLKAIFNTALKYCTIPEYYFIHEGYDSVKNSFTYIENGTLDGSQIDYEGYVYTITLEQEIIDTRTVVLGKTKRSHLADAPYDMFCMPYDEGYVYYEGKKAYTNNKFAALNMAVSVGIGSGKDANGKDIAGKIYDIQLLPYCPVRNAIKDGKLDISTVPHNFVSSSDGKKNYSVMLWCDQSNFTFDLAYNINVSDYKTSNELDVYRLCSPNYAAVFEFSPAKNKGVTKFNVDATYKPFNPYVHINPDFKGLYGADFDDSRGLILSGDFSITQLNSAFANYELTNKNFEASFQRQIENLDVNNEYQRKSEVANAITGVLTGAGAGAMMGSPNPIAMGIGGLAGGVASAAAGAMDIKYNDALRAENKEFMQDMHDMNLANIKAIPYTISKTTALTANNKLFPFVEYYTCTPTERQAFVDKINYTGMTVNRIGTIQEFMQNKPSFIRGKLIRLESLKEDFHYINSLASELSQGIYI